MSVLRGAASRPAVSLAAIQPSQWATSNSAVTVSDVTFMMQMKGSWLTCKTFLLKPCRSLLYTASSLNPLPSHELIAGGEKCSPTVQEDHWESPFRHLKLTKKQFTLLPGTHGKSGATEEKWREGGLCWRACWVPRNDWEWELCDFTS